MTARGLVRFGAVAAAALVAVPLLLFGMQERKGESGRLHLFFSPEDPFSGRFLTRLSSLRKDHPKPEVSFHLLVRDFRNLSGTPSAAFQAMVDTLKDSGGPEFGLALFDEEGVSLARRLGVSKLPAAALEQGGRSHVAYGSDLNLEELLVCRR
jgi:hypothetical protein